MMPAMPMKKSMPMEPDQDDKGGARMDGGMGEGVREAGSSDGLKDGYDCLAKFPLTSEFWTKQPKHGQA